MNRFTGGEMSFTGACSHRLTRDLGGLRPGAQLSRLERARLAVIRFLVDRHTSLREDVAYMLRGAVDGHLALQSRLSAVKLSLPSGADDETARKVRALFEDGLAHVLPAYFRGVLVQDFGVVSTRLITTAGVNYLVDAFQNSTEMENLKYHGYGTGNTAEATGDTALVTELTTQYASDNTRPTGTTTEGASANIYRTVATLSPDSGGTIAIVEHGVFSQAATGGGTLWDRSVFSAVNLVAGSDSLQTTYDMTASAGG